MLRWQEADFLSIFGPPALRVDAIATPVPPGNGFARLSVEPRAVALGGIREIRSIGAFNPAFDKDHTDLYDVGSMGRIEVFFDQTGRPQYIGFFMLTDAGFALLTDDSAIQRRLAWERPRFEAMRKEIDSRWDRRVPWKVDREKQRAQLRGLDSVDPSELWQALADWAEQKQYRGTTERQQDGRESRRWYDGGRVVAEASRFQDSSG